MKTAIAAMVALGALTSCGEDDGAPGPVDGAVVDGGCQPQSSAGFARVWKPPQTTPNACTASQIDEAFRRCESASATTADCAAFNRDPAHAQCRNCLYSTYDESTYGPLVYLRNRVLSVNLPGCLALADGNLDPTGCGARLQAFESCRDAVCIETCTTFDAYQRCLVEAGNTVCLTFADDSTCKDAATYAPCLDNTTFEGFYRTLAKVFCGSGFAGGGASDGGAGDGGGLLPREMSWFRRIAPDALRTRSTVEMRNATGR